MRAKPDARLLPDRPLPPYAYLPGGPHPHPIVDPRGHTFGRDDASDPHAFAWGIDLFDHGYFWEAHEAWEPLWRAAAGKERALLHGLVQCAAVCLKLREGRRDAARRLATRALAHLDDARGAPRFGLDVDELAQAFAAWSRALAIDDRPLLASRCAR